MILVHSLFLNFFQENTTEKQFPCSMNLVSCSDRHLMIFMEPSSEISPMVFLCSKIWLDIKFLQLGGYSIDQKSYFNFQNKFIHSQQGYLLCYQHGLIPGNSFLVIIPTHLQSTYSIKFILPKKSSFQIMLRYKSEKVDSAFCFLKTKFILFSLAMKTAI